jgi:hypothetical protein
MAKEKSLKYKEAVERNIRNAKKDKYISKSIGDAKRMLGIRDGDFSYDEQVEKLVRKER